MTKKKTFKIEPTNIRELEKRHAFAWECWCDVVIPF